MNDGVVWLLISIVVVMFAVLCVAGCAIFMLLAKNGKHEACSQTACSLCADNQCMWEFRYKVTIGSISPDCPRLKRLHYELVDTFSRRFR